MFKAIQHVDNYAEYLKLIGEEACVVKFTAEWCGPCKRIAPFYEEMATKHCDEVKFLEIDIDGADQITNHENVQSIPLFLFYKDGKKQTELRGGNPTFLGNNIGIFINDVRLSKTKEENNVVNSVDKEQEEENSHDQENIDEIIEKIIDEQSLHNSSDESWSVDDDLHNEYGEECEIIIEKTISDDMINES